MTHCDVLIRCDASPELGWGHVVRCQAIAEAMQAQGQAAPAFLMQARSLGVDRVRSAGFQVYPVDAGHLTGKGFVHAVLMSGASVLLVDVRDALSRHELDCVRAEGVRVVVLDDASDRRLAADMVVYPPVPQVQDLDWTGFSGERYIGWEWIPLRTRFAQCAEAVQSASPRLLVSLGGTDPNGITLQVLDALADIDAACEIRVVIGAGGPHAAAIRAAVASMSMYCSCLEDVSDMAAQLCACDVAIVAFGMTAYEAAACGVPAVYVCGSEDHARSASALEQAAVGCSLGVMSDGMIVHLRKTVTDLLHDLPRRTAMAAHARALIDGQGAYRIAQLLQRDTAGMSRARC